MLFERPFAVLAVQVLSLCIIAHAKPQYAGIDYEVAKRQAPGSVSAKTTGSTSSRTTYTLITPSPSASPVAITSQSQVVTTYIPIMTMCAMGLVPVTLTPKYGNSTASYGNRTYSVSSSLSESCTTYYNTTTTSVCATVLTGIATNYNVTSCSQDITFSTAYGYYQTYATHINSSAYTGALSPIEMRTSYWLAPWQALTAGLTPDQVTQKVCSNPVASASASQQCIDTFESWITFVVTSMTSSTSHVDLTTTISGPSQIIIETFHADITETMTVFSISTVMVLEYSTETTSTSTRTLALTRSWGQSGISDADVTTTSTAPTVSSTVTVEARKTATAEPSSSTKKPKKTTTSKTKHSTTSHKEITSTKTVKVTTTIHSTVTRTLPSPAR